MKRPTRAAALVALAIVAVTARNAEAQTREADAERLFREGQKLMEERRYGEACPKFDSAYKKDGALGTLINLAFCHKEQGAIWYAWLEFREAEVKATELNRPDRRDFAHARLTELEKNLPKVIIDNPHKVPLTEVLVEDRKVWEAERGAVFAAEAGQRKFTFRAKGKKPATTLVHVARGDRAQRVTVPDLETATADDLPPPPAPPPVAPPPAPPPPRDSLPPAPPPSPASGVQRTVGWIMVGVGGGAAMLGGVTGGLSWFGPCGQKACAPDERDRASTTAAISTVSFMAAGALVIGGIVVLLTAPSSSSSAAAPVAPSRFGVVPAAGPTWAGLSGTF